MIRARARLLESDDEATTRARVADMLAEHVPDEAERHWLEPAMLALLGIETGVPSEQLFGAWRTFFERLAESAPVVLVFEDFHHADTGLLDFVDSLVDWSRSSPILVVTLARPELLDRRPDWGAAKRSFTSLHLEPLAEPAMRELLAGLVPGLPEAAVRPIVARADGIPLYAVETVRMLLADGRLEERDGAYVPVGDLGDARRPGDAHGADRLPARRPRSGRPLAGLGRVRPGAVVHRGRPGRRVGPRRGGRRAAAPGAGAPRDPLDRRGPTLARAGPVHVRAGAHPRGRLPHAGPAGPQVAPPRRGPVPRGRGFGRARRGPREPLPRCPGERPRGRRAGCARGSGPDRPPGRGPTCRGARIARSGRGLPGAGALDHRRSRARGRAPVPAG